MCVCVKRDKKKQTHTHTLTKQPHISEHRRAGLPQCRHAVTCVRAHHTHRYTYW